MDCVQAESALVPNWFVPVPEMCRQGNTATGGNLPSGERGRDCYRFPMADLVSTSSALSASGLTVLERLAFELAARGATRAFERTERRDRIMLSLSPRPRNGLSVKRVLEHLTSTTRIGAIDRTANR
jgi:hypothetical protein